MSTLNKDINEIYENSNETEFEQKCALINYGVAPVSTCNLVNCIAIGGNFDLDEKTGSFLTHESPTDYLEHKNKLYKIKEILNKKNAKITKIILFHVDKPSKDIYSNGLTTLDIIHLMFEFCINLFELYPQYHNYLFDNLSITCGKAIISATQYSTEQISFKFKDKKHPIQETSLETFIVDVLYNNFDEKIYKCPICNYITGTYAPKFPHDISFFAHFHNCSNKNKIPIEK